MQTEFDKLYLSRRAFLAGSLVVAGAAALGARTEQAGAEQADGTAITFTPGSYEATEQGHAFDVTVRVAFTEHEVESVEVVENAEAEFFSSYAIELLASDVVKYQTPEVDVCSGASETSRGILACVQSCFDQAGAAVEGGGDLPEKPAPEQLAGEDAECDVLVIGAGAAGILAALSAATADGTASTDSGLSVMVVEQLPFAGGSFVVSGAGMFSIYGDPQHEAGEFDTIDEDAFVRYLTARSEDDYLGCISEDLQRVCYRSIFPAETLMIDCGAPFSYSQMSVVDAMALQGEGWSDNAFANLAFLDEDGNRIAENSGPIADIVGKGFVSILGAKGNVELRTSTEAVSFIVEDGAVAGVNVVATDQAANTQTSYAIRAKKVVCATGSPNLNYDFLQEHGFDLIEANIFSGAGSTGRVPGMLEEAGLKPVVIGNGGMCYNGTGPEFGMEDGIALGAAGLPFLNKEGKRYFDEGATQPFDTGRFTAGQTDNTTYAIADSGANYLMGNEPMYYDGNDGKVLAEYAVERGWAVKADTLEELMGMIDIDAEAALATLEKFNAAAAGETQDELGCSPETMISVTVPPFYAVTIHAVRAEPYIGLKVAEGGSTQIADASGQPIPNLYGAGTLVGPNLFYHRYFQYCGGLTTALAVGYAAGAEARDAILGA